MFPVGDELVAVALGLFGGVVVERVLQTELGQFSQCCLAAVVASTLEKRFPGKIPG